MEKIRYRFSIIYQPKQFKRASELMRKFDLEIGQVAAELNLDFKCDEKPIDIIKGNIINAFECAELLILKIEGGKIE